MIKSYEVIEEKKGKKRVSIKEENRSTEIICNANNPLQDAITKKNTREILSNKKRVLEGNLCQYTKNKNQDLGRAISMGLLSVVSAGTILGLAFSHGLFTLGLIATVVVTAFPVGITLDSIKELINNKKVIKDLKTVISNIDMMITRTHDKSVSEEKDKQEYFEQDKNNIHLTNVCVSKLDEDLNKNIYDRWYGLNQDTCAKIIKTTKKKTLAKEKMWDVFVPVSLNPMDTKRFIKNKVYTKSR